MMMLNIIMYSIMFVCGWSEVLFMDLNWDLFYVDVGWIYENVFYKSGAYMAEY